jgi:hypothetical protein
MNYLTPTTALALLFMLGGCSKPPYQCVTFQAFDEGNGQAVLPFARYDILTQEGEIYRSTTNKYGYANAVPTRYPDAAQIEFPETLPGLPVERLPSFEKTLSLFPANAGGG